jgi:hypothetical protein
MKLTITNIGNKHASQSEVYAFFTRIVLASCTQKNCKQLYKIHSFIKV